MPDPDPINPSHPESAPDATQRLSKGSPEDPYSTQQLDVAQHLETAGISPPPLDPEQTRNMSLPTLYVPPIRLQKEDSPVEAAGQTLEEPSLPPARRPFGWKVPLGLAALGVLGIASYLWFSHGPRPQAAPPEAEASAETTPPGAQVYLEKARAGDAHSMRMLGVMYYYGLNVPQDREKGLYWYRQAAEKGSEAARSELNKLEGGH